MRRKKKLTLQKYWETKLNINYSKEYKCYQELCGSRVIKSKDSPRFKTYNNWKAHIVDTVKYLSQDELNEYSRYLNLMFRDNSVKYTLSQIILIPVVLSLGVSVLVEPLLKTFEKMELYFGICLFVFVVFTFIFLREFFSIKDDSDYAYFYSDMKEIVDELTK